MKICTQTALFVFFFLSGGRNNVQYAFHYNFKNKTGQYGKKKKKKKNKEGTFTTIFAAGRTSSFLLRPTEVNLSDANKKKKTSFARVIAIYEFPVTVLAFRADVLRGSSRVPGTREEPLRTSAWEATPEVIAKVDSVQSPL